MEKTSVTWKHTPSIFMFFHTMAKSEAMLMYMKLQKINTFDSNFASLFEIKVSICVSLSY